MNKQSSESQSISDWWNVTSNLSISEWLDGSVPRSYGEVPEPKSQCFGALYVFEGSPRPGVARS